MNELTPRAWLCWSLLLLIAMAAAALAIAVAPLPAYAAEEAIVVQSVVTSAYPDMVVRCTLPRGLLGEGEPEFAVFENGRPGARVRARRLPAAQLGPVSVVLVMDASGSMSGRALGDAKAAARAFVEKMRPGDRISLVEFSSSPKMLSGFTTERSPLLSSIGGLEAGGETAVYDALIVAAGVAGKASSPRSVVLLSDGGDTVSRQDKDAALAALRGNGVPVYAVALDSAEADFGSLSQIAGVSGGRFLTVRDSGGLTRIYEDLAAELQSPYEIRYVSSPTRAKDLEVDVVASSGGMTVNGWRTIRNPGLNTRAAVVWWLALFPPLADRTSLAMLAFVFVAVFLAVAVLAFAIAAVLSPEQGALDQLAFYDQLRVSAEGVTDQRSAFEQRVLAVVGEVAGRRGLTRLVTLRLERAGLPLRPVEYILFHLTAVVGVGLIAQVATRNLPLSIAIVVFVTVGPIYALELLGRRRTRKFDRQLPDILNLIAGSLRAGYGLLQAIGLVVEEMAEPAAGEFQRVQTEARLGLRLEDALDKMADRLGSVDFHWVVMAMNIQREVGGNLAEILDIVSTTIRDRESLRGQVRALTAEGRLSASILMGLPFVVALGLYFINRQYLSLLLVEPIGRLVALSALVSLMLGGIWLNKVSKVEV